MEDKATIQELLEQFDFSELTEKQKKEVLLQISEEEYNELREAHNVTVDFFDNEPSLIADKALKPVLKTTSVLLSILNYKIPFYKVAAAAILMFSFYFLTNKTTSTETIEFADQSTQINNNDSVAAVMVSNALTKYTSNNSIKHHKGIARFPFYK